MFWNSTIIGCPKSPSGSVKRFQVIGRMHSISAHLPNGVSLSQPMHLLITSVLTFAPRGDLSRLWGGIAVFLVSVDPCETASDHEDSYRSNAGSERGLPLCVIQLVVHPYSQRVSMWVAESSWPLSVRTYPMPEGLSSAPTCTSYHTRCPSFVLRRATWKTQQACENLA